MMKKLLNVVALEAHKGYEHGHICKEYSLFSHTLFQKYEQTPKLDRGKLVHKAL